MTTDPRRGSWLTTYPSNGKFWPLDPRPAEIDLRDIAHALGQSCRFNGFCDRHYSVAEHSVRCLYELRTTERADLQTERWALLHDAAEAYLGDLVRPVKALFPGFRRLEDRVLECIADRFRLPWPMPEAVKAADNRLCLREAVSLGLDISEWSGAPDPNTITPILTAGWPAAQAETQFLELADALLIK